MTDFSMNIVEEVLLSNMTDTREFKEYCSNLDKLSSLIPDEFFIEEVVTPKSKISKKASGIAKNTIDTTKTATGVYGMATDVGGAYYKSVWSLTFACLKLMMKVISYFIFKLIEIPEMLVKLINAIGEIPASIKNKIKGNIKLFITVNDIDTLYNNNVVKMLDDYIGDMNRLSVGEVWSTFFHPRIIKGKDENNTKVEIKENDMKIIRDMNKIYKQLKLVKFSETLINMSKGSNVNIYFSKEVSIKFTDLRGNHHEYSYLEALMQLMKDLNERSDTIKRLQADITSKYTEGEANLSYSRLGPLAQKNISTTIQEISMVINTIGNIVKCVMTDISTIDKSIKLMIKKKRINSSDTINPGESIETIKQNQKDSDMINKLINTPKVNELITKHKWSFDSATISEDDDHIYLHGKDKDGKDVKVSFDK